MIQSMEILQLPIMALEERIQQELVENPILDMQEEDPDLPAEEEPEREAPDAPSDEEARVGHRARRGTTRPTSSGCLTIDEQWPDHFEEHARLRAIASMKKGPQHDAMANMVARPQSLQDYLHDQLDTSTFALPCGRWPTGSSTIWTSTATCKGAWKNLLGPEATADDMVLAREALATVQRLNPPGVAARDLKECLLLQLLRACLITSSSARSSAIIWKTWSTIACR